MNKNKSIQKPITEKDNQNIWDELQAFRDKHRLDELDIDTDLFDADRKAAIVDTTKPKTQGQKMLNLMEQHSILGCMEGDGNLSVDYKKHLWGNK